MVATATLSTVRADSGAEARHQPADAHELDMPRELSEARSFIENGGFVNQAHEHDRDHDVANNACGYMLCRETSRRAFIPRKLSNRRSDF